MKLLDKNIAGISLKRAILVILAVAAVDSIALIGSADAAINQGPNPGDFSISGAAADSNGTQDMFFLVDNYGVGAETSIVSLYFTSSVETVTIKGADLCNDGTRKKDGASPSNVTTTYRLESYSPLNPTDPGDIYDTKSIKGCKDKDKAVDGYDLALSTDGLYSAGTTTAPNGIPNDSDNTITLGGVKYYRAKLRATITDEANAGNTFRVVVGSGDVVSYFNKSGTGFTVQDRGYYASGTTRWTSYTFKFAADCDVTSPQPNTRLKWYDDDWRSIQYNSPNTTATSADTAIWPQAGWYRMKLVEKDRTSHAVTNTWELKYDYSTIDWHDSNITSTFDNSYPGSGISNYKGQKESSWAEFTIRPDYQYEWTWYDVKRINAVQFELPYDSVYYDKECPAPVVNTWDYNARKLTGTTADGSSIIQGGTITYVSDVQNSPATMDGPAYTHTIKVTDGSSSLVSSSTGTWTGTSIAADDDTDDQTGTYTIKDDASVGDKICINAYVTPVAGNSVDGVTNSGSDSAGEICVTVKAAPEWTYQSRTIDKGPGTGRNSTDEGEVNAGGDLVTFWSDVFNDTTVDGTEPHDHYVFISNTDAADISDYLHPLDVADPYIGDLYNYDAIASISGPGSTMIKWDGNAIDADSNSADKRVGYRIKSDAKDGGWFCIQASAEPYRGNSVGTILEQTSDSTLSEERCYTIYNKRYDFKEPTVSFGKKVATPGETVGISYKLCNEDDELSLLGAGSGAVRGPSPSTRLWTTNPVNMSGGSIDDSHIVKAFPDPSCVTVDEDASGNPLTFKVSDTATVGKPVCVTINAANDYGFSNDSWNGGTRPQIKEYCMIVGVAPYLQVESADVWAGANFDTQNADGTYNYPVESTCGTDNTNSAITSVTSNLSGLWRGSFVEYASFSLGLTSGFGSANSAGSAHSLTFANSNSPEYGKFSSTPRCIPNYYGLLSEYSYDPTDITTNNSANLSSFSGNEQSLVKPTSGQFTLTGTNTNFTSNKTIVVKGDVLLPKDIKFKTPYTTSPSLKVPSLIIVASGDIYIDQSVNQVDAILISQGAGGIWTCSNGFSPITEVAKDVCQEPLTINGALIANRVNFMRTHEGTSSGTKIYGGVHDDKSKPAEIINFSPEFLLSDPVFKSKFFDDKNLQTVLFKDLPPVY